MVPKRAIKKKLIPAKRPANKKPAVSGQFFYRVLKKDCVFSQSTASHLSLLIAATEVGIYKRKKKVLRKNNYARNNAINQEKNVSRKKGRQALST